MTISADEITQIVEPTVSGLGYNLWGVTSSGSGKRAKICVYIDADTGITIEDCEKVSEHICAVLDIENTALGTYDLEVSSPGLDRILFQPKHFQASIGDRVDVRLHVPVGNTRRVQGTLKECTGEEILVRADDSEYRFSFPQLRRVRVVPQFHE